MYVSNDPGIAGFPGKIHIFLHDQLSQQTQSSMKPGGKSFSNFAQSALGTAAAGALGATRTSYTKICRRSKRNFCRRWKS